MLTVRRHRSGPRYQVSSQGRRGPVGRGRGEVGQVTAMMVILSVALLALGGLVFDGARVLSARREANNLALSAARAGAQQIDVTAARNGTFVLNPVAADTAVRSYLTTRGITPTSVVVDPDRVSVTVQLYQETPMLSLLGIASRTVTATASARPARGVTSEGS